MRNVASRNRTLRRSRQLSIRLLFEGEHFLHARALLHSLKVRHAMSETTDVDLEGGSAAETPEKVRIRRREVIEKVLSPGKHLIRDAEHLEKFILRQSTGRVLSARDVTNGVRYARAAKQGMNT